MRKIAFTILMLFPCVTVSYLLYKGVIVDYERNTGSELIVLFGKNNLLKKSLRYGVNNSNYAYTTYEFDSRYGFENIGISFAFYRVIDSRLIEGGLNQKVPVIEVKQFYSIYLIIGIIVLYFLVLFFVMRKRSANSPPFGRVVP